MDQTALALNNLATATSEDKQIVDNVATVNTTVMAQLTRAIESLTTIQARLSTLENRVSNKDGNGGRNGPRTKNMDNQAYCFSHGCTRRGDHTSGTCNNTIEGHTVISTLSNRQGESNYFCGN